MTHSSRLPLADGLSCLTVEEFHGFQGEEWDRHTARFPDVSFFHTSSWIQVLQSSYGFRPLGFVFCKSDVIIGMIPMVEVVNRVTGCRGVSLPFADECPPLVRADWAGDGLLKPLATIGQERRWNYFEIRGSNVALCPTIPSVTFHGHRITLPKHEADLWQGLKGSVRTAIRKAESSAVTIEVSNSLSTLREFHRLYCLTRQRHGLPPQPFSFFKVIHRHIFERNLGEVIMARVGGKCVAGAVFLRNGGRVLFKYGAFDSRFQHVRANNLVFWAALKRYQQMGCETVDLGRTSLGNDGLRRFKQGWGGMEYEIKYSKYDLHENQFVKEKDLAEGFYNWAFRLCPRWVSAIVGKTLYKYWA